MHSHGELWCAERPALGEQEVIDILKPDSGPLTENIDFVEDFLKVDEADGPGIAALLDHGFEGRCRGAMAAPGVKKQKIQVFHALRDCHSTRDGHCGSIETVIVINVFYDSHGAVTSCVFNGIGGRVS